MPNPDAMVVLGNAYISGLSCVEKNIKFGNKILDQLSSNGTSATNDIHFSHSHLFVDYFNHEFKLSTSDDDYASTYKDRYFLQFNIKMINYKAAKKILIKSKIS